MAAEGGEIRSASLAKACKCSFLSALAGLRSRGWRKPVLSVLACTDEIDRTHLVADAANGWGKTTVCLLALEPLAFCYRGGSAGGVEAGIRSRWGWLAPGRVQMTHARGPASRVVKLEASPDCGSGREEEVCICAMRQSGGSGRRCDGAGASVRRAGGGRWRDAEQRCWEAGREGNAAVQQTGRMATYMKGWRGVALYREPASRCPHDPVTRMKLTHPGRRQTDQADSDAITLWRTRAP